MVLEKGIFLNQLYVVNNRQTDNLLRLHLQYSLRFLPPLRLSKNPVPQIFGRSHFDKIFRMGPRLKPMNARQPYRSFIPAIIFQTFKIAISRYIQNPYRMIETNAAIALTAPSRRTAPNRCSFSNMRSLSLKFLIKLIRYYWISILFYI